MGKVVAFIGSINEMDFQKDVILTPSYLAKWLNTTCEFYFGEKTTTKELPKTFRNLNLHYIGKSERKLLYWIILFKKIIFNVKDVKCIMTFHLSTKMIIITLLIKLLKPDIKVWILGDLNQDVAERLYEKEFVFSNGFMGFLKRKLVNIFFHRLDIYSLETKKYVNMFKPLFEKNKWTCLTYFPCGWDEDNPNSTKVNEKEHIILSCARFGTFQKNTEMLLEGIENTALKDWKVFLVGPITSDFSLEKNTGFETYIKNYFIKNPHLKDKVIFTGAIFDTAELFSYFRKASIFVMTSRFEGFANVFSQARWNQCIIVSTDVGGACDMSCNWKYGAKVQQSSPESLSLVLNNILKNEFKIPPRDFADGISYNMLIPQYILPHFK